MEIAFCRIDDRLIHGQVATVWTKVTGCNRIMCCNDDVAQDTLRKKLLLQVAPPGIKAYVIPVEKAVAAYKNPKYAPFKTLFLFTNPRDVVRAVNQVGQPRRHDLQGRRHADLPGRRSQQG